MLECDDGERMLVNICPIDLVHSPLVTVVGRVTALLPLVTTCDHRRCATIKHDSMTHLMLHSPALHVHHLGCAISAVLIREQLRCARSSVSIVSVVTRRQSIVTRRPSPQTVT